MIKIEDFIVKSEIATWGKCSRCGKHPAIYMPLRLCESCHRKLAGISDIKKRYEFLGKPYPY